MKGKAGIIIAAVVAVLLLGIGGFVYAKKFMAKPVQNNVTTTTAKPSPQANTLFSSIQDALSKNLSLSCSFKDANGSQTVTYIKNGMIRADVTGSSPTNSGTVIMRDGKMYFWNDKSAIVLAFNIKDAQKNAPAVPAGSAQSPQNYMTMMEKYRESCKTVTVSDSLFVIPTNVKFQDLSQMMKGLQNNVGSNSAVPPVAVPSNYQQMMQQYQNSVQK